MARRLSIILLYLLNMVMAYGQTDLQLLCELVDKLRKCDATTYGAVVKVLSTTEGWTPMNELRAADATTECRASDRVPGFRLNKALAGAEQATRYETAGGNMLNGEDSRYNFSLLEKGIKAGKTAQYSVSGRYGAQTFVVMPYEKSTKYKIDIQSSDGTAFEKHKDSNGVTTLKGIIKDGDKMIIKLTNSSGQNASFVLLNHNSRK